MPESHFVWRRPAGARRGYDREDGMVFETRRTEPASMPIMAEKDREERVESAFFSVLVAECNPAILQVVAMMFQALGCRVSTARGWGEAVGRFARSPVNLVVSEFCMGKVNGCQLAAYIKERSPRTRVLIMTGRCQSEVAAEMRSSCVDGWIFKPFGFEELLDILEEMKLPRACPRFPRTKRSDRLPQTVKHVEGRYAVL